MKHAPFAIIAALVLTGCNEPAPEKSTIQDYQTLLAEMAKNDDSGGTPVLATGARGDFIIRLAKTPELMDIWQRAKTTQFVSIDAPKQYISDEYCIVNVIPYNILLEMGAGDSVCHYRLFCGTARDMKYKKMYAVELCDHQWAPDVLADDLLSDIL